MNDAAGGGPIVMLVVDVPCPCTVSTHDVNVLEAFDVYVLRARDVEPNVLLIVVGVFSA